MTIFTKQIGNVCGTVSEETIDEKPSYRITFTRRQPDGTESQVFTDEGDLAQLGMVLWRVQDHLNKRQDNQSRPLDAAV